MLKAWQTLKGAFSRPQGDVQQGLGDLAVFFGYFLVSFYAGGNAYLTAYGDAFHIKLVDDPGSLSILATFVTEVLGGFFYLPIVAISVVVVLLYFVSRYVVHFSLGFMIMVVTLLSALVGFSSVGTLAGERRAETDKLALSTRPLVQLAAKAPIGGVDLTQQWRLLHQDADRIYIFQDQSVRGSLVLVYAIKKDLIDSYEVTTSWQD